MNKDCKHLTFIEVCATCGKMLSDMEYPIRQRLWPVEDKIEVLGVTFFRRSHSPYLSDVVGDNYAYVIEYAPPEQEKAWAASVHDYQTIRYITSINGLQEQEALEWAANKLLELKGK